ncbi:MAG: hypothetical protein JXA22_01410 [Candidatus Thermoplasmatota archaeon]|nr:hypothetical protein [Candidatus Thermoplasmatota archaeon]
MILNNNEMILWEEPSNLIIKGEVTSGHLFLTNRRMVFVQMQVSGPSLLKRNTRSDVTLWEQDIWGVMDVSLLDMMNFKHPLVRIRYKEGEVFLTFPTLEPKPALAAMVVFINHARLISKNMSLMENIRDNLRSGELKVGERLPRLVIDQPMRSDETCHQCAKTMLEEETDILASEIKECLMCPE